ncbi:MAG TPA: hypothetical protein VK605_04505 [Solirubrobacteraceae bacterium]|nr:hypothetical protein [Solirubrobacteraceae bacterium]
MAPVLRPGTRAPALVVVDTMSKTQVLDNALQNIDARRARLRSLWAMTPAQRIAAMRRGELSLDQCCAWAARHPEQVPLLNGEFEYLAAYMPEVCERERDA